MISKDVSKSAVNYILIEGTLLNFKGKKDKSGSWLLIRSKSRGERLDGRGTFRIDLPASLASRYQDNLIQGTKLRIVGRLERESRLGAYVRAEHLECRPVLAGALS